MIIKCPFCKGSGKDPFQLLSSESDCQVCGGSGTVKIDKPAIKCAFCGGRGIHPGTRLSCTVCGGKGMVTIKNEKSEKCSACNGTGHSVYNSVLPCSVCGGKGIK